MDNLFSELKSIDICSEKQYKEEHTPEECDRTTKDESEKHESFEIDSVSVDKHKGIGILRLSNINTTNAFLKCKHEISINKQRIEDMELHNINYEFPYKRAKLLTDAEMQLFKFMRDNLCQADKIVILVKVRLADIAEVDSRITLDKNFLWKITNKHVDFLICEKNNLDIICAVELDDYTHESKEAKERDMFVMQVLDTVGIKTIRIKTKIRALEKTDLELVDDCINIKLAPRCSNCGRQMYPKMSRKGHRFYACEDFINCRSTLDIDPKGEN